MWYAFTLNFLLFFGNDITFLGIFYYFLHSFPFSCILPGEVNDFKTQKRRKAVYCISSFKTVCVEPQQTNGLLKEVLRESEEKRKERKEEK